MAIAHENVKCRETDEMWELSTHLKSWIYNSLLKRVLFLDMKTLLTIDKEYISKYEIDSSLEGKRIVIYDDRYAHIDKHSNDFSSYEVYEYVVSNIDLIIENPDFITENTNNKSLEFVKRMDDNVLVAARLSESKDLKIKTLYPINDIKYNKLKKKKVGN